LRLGFKIECVLISWCVQGLPGPVGPTGDPGDRVSYCHHLMQSPVMLFESYI